VENPILLRPFACAGPTSLATGHGYAGQEQIQITKTKENRRKTNSLFSAFVLNFFSFPLLFRVSIFEFRAYFLSVCACRGEASVRSRVCGNSFLFKVGC
jgi:hypothetical protein